MPTYSFLHNPKLFNSVRSVIAGSQKNTKEFVSNVLNEYHVKSVMDVGCGTGDFATTVPRDSTYTGVDLNSNFIEFAQEKYHSKRFNWLVANVTDKSFYLKRKTDATLFISMLHHLSDAELHIMLPVIKRITNKIIVVADIIPNPPGILRKTMVKLDQGEYIRTSQDKLSILRKYFTIKQTGLVTSRLAVQFCIVCTP